MAIAASVAVVLTACGNEPLPPSRLANQAPSTETTAPTTLPLFPSDANILTDDQPDTDPVGDVTTSDPTPVPNRAAVLETALTWTDATANLLGLESTCGNVSYLSAHPHDDQLFAGISAHGLFRLDAESNEWTPLGTEASSDRIDNRTAWIEYDPLNPDRFWEAGSYGAGVFRTDDGGATFTRAGDIRHIDYVSTDLTDPQRSTLLAGGHEERIVHLSRDGGSTWTDISDTLPPNVGHTSFPVVIDSSTFLVGTRRDDNAGIFRSEDGGGSWTRVYDGAITGPPLIDGNTVYWLADQGGGLIVSEDGGATFARQAGRIGGRPSTLSQLQDGRLATHDDAAVLISDDQGASWFAAGPPLPFTPNGIVVSPNDAAIYAWSFTCNFGDVGNPVLPESIIRLDLPQPDSDINS